VSVCFSCVHVCMVCTDTRYMSGNCVNMQSNAVASSAASTPIIAPVALTELVRPNPSDSSAFLAWSNRMMHENAPPNYTKFIVFSGMGAKHGINYYIGSLDLVPRCRNSNCAFHALGKACHGVTCGRGQAGCGKMAEKFAVGPMYATADPYWAGRYGEDAVKLDIHEKIGYVVLTCVLLVPSHLIYHTSRDKLLKNTVGNRNFWWEQMGCVMIVVDNSVGAYVNDQSSYDIAINNPSKYVHITRCTPAMRKPICPANGLAMCMGVDGVMVTDPEKARAVGVYATKEIALAELKKSTNPWDIHDAKQKKVCPLFVVSIYLFVTQISPNFPVDHHISRLSKNTDPGAT